MPCKHNIYYILILLLMIEDFRETDYYLSVILGKIINIVNYPEYLPAGIGSKVLAIGFIATNGTL